MSEKLRLPNDQSVKIEKKPSLSIGEIELLGVILRENSRVGMESTTSGIAENVLV